MRISKNGVGEYRKMVESGLVPEIGESVRVSKNILAEYRKRVELL